MPSKTKTKNAAIAARTAALPQIPKELLDQFVAQGSPMTAEQISATTMALKKALIERALGAELSHHLGDLPGVDRPAASGNHRNGRSAKTVHTKDGPLRIEVPRDREGSFEPVLIPKHERRFTGFDDKIVALYARGMTVREIQGFLAEQYGAEVSPEFISSVTDAVMAEVSAWQSRPPRGIEDILIAVTDGLKGIPEALGALYPATTLQTCIVHLIRNSLDFASWKDRKALAAALKPIYTAASAEAAAHALDAFEAGAWGVKFPTVVGAWRRVWDRVIPFFAFSPAVRRVIYTTNAIESIHARLRKIIKTRGHFPSDDAATKLIWLALRNITADWGARPRSGARR